MSSQDSAFSNVASQARMARTLGFFFGRGFIGQRIRMAILLIILGMYWFILALLADFPSFIPTATLNSLPLLLRIILDVVASFFAPPVLLHLLPVALGILIGLVAAAYYLADLFELESVWIAWRYLLNALFGWNPPVLTIASSELGSLDQSNPLLRIGGPGYLNLHLGFAAVFESVEGKPKIYAPSRKADGAHRFFVQGFDRLQEVIDLRDQIRLLDQVQAVTRDGITVFARDAQLVFRAHGGDDRSLEVPYPYDPQGILRLVYGQHVHKSGASRWTDALPSLARRELRTFVAGRGIDDFLAIDSSDDMEPSTVSSFLMPRKQLTQSFHTAEQAERLRELGLELSWVGVGTWEVRNDQIPSTDSEVAAGQRILTAARDRARARRLRSREYRAGARQHARIEYSLHFLQSVVRWWEEGELPPEYRCFEFLSNLKRRASEMTSQLESWKELHPDGPNIPSDLPVFLDHLNSITRPDSVE
jgi:hypothetical protein